MTNSGIRLIRNVVLALLAVAMAPAAQAQRAFPTPQAAAEALKAATAKFDEAALRDLFGPAYDKVKSADADQLEGNIARLHAAMKEYLAVPEKPDGKATVIVGVEAWPFPIPLAKAAAGTWSFDTAAGGEELINRRIGENELKAIETLGAYVAAQRLYASKPRGAGPLRAFAQKIRSTPGRKDGLYWEEGLDREESPFGPLISDAHTRKSGAPYYGYRFRILTAQGPGAPGGAYSYIINGNMVAGFAMIAYPAVYGNTGIMSFIVNHYGEVYEADLGRDTAERAARTTTYNPGKGWSLASGNLR